MSEEVKAMFSDISESYDKMNDIFTFKMHNNWKEKLVKLSDASKGKSVLDCASGTGDLAIIFKQSVGDTGRVVATDFCNDMLKYTKPKAEKLNLDVEVELADAMNLQFETNTFDISSISYGIRNVDDTPTALKEMARVTKSGGKIAILETGQPSAILRPFFNIMTKFLMPIIGKLIAGNKSAYQYPSETSSKYPYGKEFIQIMNDTGKLKDCKAYPQFFGASYIYIGTVV